MTQFSSANPSVVRFIKQRVMLNSWLRALASGTPLPVTADFRPDGIAEELDDMMGFDVEGDGEAAPAATRPPAARGSASGRP